MNRPRRDTATVLLTPPGTGAIGIVRVSGRNSIETVGQCFRSKLQHGLATLDRRIAFGWLDANGDRLDDVLVTVDADSDPPHVDLCMHGGIRVLEQVIQTLVERGARFQPAIPNHAVWPCDTVIEREAVDALRHAKTSRVAAFLAWQHANLVPFLRRIGLPRHHTGVDALAQFEGVIDRYTSARRLIDGVRIAIVGPPNSGKSTLLNRVVGRAAATVSATAGTTRDWVSAEIEIDGLPATLLDTAGRRTPGDLIEKEAIARGRQAALDADMRWIVLDVGHHPSPVEMEQLGSDNPLLWIWNKIDGYAPTDVAGLVGATTLPGRPLFVSALTGEGLAGLLHRTATALKWRPAADPEPSLFTLRQLEAAKRILHRMEETGKEGIRRHIPVELGARIADRLIGRTC